MGSKDTPQGLRLAFYGDDFTGSTAALEVLAFGGLRCALFPSVPTPDLEIRARLAPGAPLCAVLSSAPHVRGLELALKSGQMGWADYFVRTLRGSGRPT
jgi:uncharacterized protein YgbK (DUF1537 family)